jgi:hypothetical protein
LSTPKIPRIQNFLEINIGRIFLKTKSETVIDPCGWLVVSTE